MDIATLRRQLLDKALPLIEEHGWTSATLEKAASKAKFEKGTAAIVCPRGPVDLVDEFALLIDEEMLDGLNQAPFATMGTTDRVKTSVIKRLEALETHCEAERKAIGVLSSPQNMRRGMKILWRTADTIWQTAGDTSTDYNHYTKRFLLSSVLSKTTLYWLGDDSENYHDTHAFLDRQIKLVLKAGKAFGSLKKPLDKAAPVFHFLKSKISKASY